MHPQSTVSPSSVSLSHAYTLARIAKNLCQWCSAPLTEQDRGRLCPACIEKRKVYVRARREKARAKGLCAVCCHRPAVAPFIKCEHCAEMSRRKGKRHRQQKAARGLCNNCGKPALDMPGKFRFCEACYCRIAAGNTLGLRSLGPLLQQKLADQNSVCPYTGSVLKLGVNASVEHRLPVSRYPHLKQDPDNIEWIRVDVNLMKKDRTREEFLEIINIIAAYCRP